jgi:hypothetical protein
MCSTAVHTPLPTGFLRTGPVLGTRGLKKTSIQLADNKDLFACRRYHGAVATEMHLCETGINMLPDTHFFHGPTQLLQEDHVTIKR